MLTLAEVTELREMFNDEELDADLKEMAWYIFSLWQQNDFKNEEIIYIKETGTITNVFFIFKSTLFMLSDESGYWNEDEISLRKICGIENGISKSYLRKFLRNVEWTNEQDYFEGEEEQFDFELQGEDHEEYVEMTYGLLEILKSKGFKVIG